MKIPDFVHAWEQFVLSPSEFAQAVAQWPTHRSRTNKRLFQEGRLYIIELVSQSCLQVLVVMVRHMNLGHCCEPTKRSVAFCPVANSSLHHMSHLMLLVSASASTEPLCFGTGTDTRLRGLVSASLNQKGHSVTKEVFPLSPLAHTLSVNFYQTEQKWGWKMIKLRERHWADLCEVCQNSVGRKWKKVAKKKRVSEEEMLTSELWWTIVVINFQMQCNFGTWKPLGPTPPF